ncbi:MAG: hypothetical protein LAT65_17265 [Saccharospirillum sp.]|nr:hypothetical protein [Saccharospirillum sp.]
MPRYTLVGDECMVSLALERNLDPKELWESDANEALREERALFNCLAEGDTIALPDDSGGHELQMNQEQTLVVSKTRYRLPIRVVSPDWQAASGVTLKCWAESLPQPLETESNAEGIGWFELPLDVTEGFIAMEFEDRAIIRPFLVGRLDPPELESGRQQRLENLNGSFIPNRPADELITALADDSGMTKDQLDALLVGTVT